MQENLPALLCVGTITFLFVIPSWLYIEYSERRARREAEAAVKAGRNQPVTIQPLVDLRTCMGSGACATACPEHVLRVVDGQAIAVNMAACVGHGVCVPACPVDAIELVFGSEKRGIDIPDVNGKFETNVPGLFVAGELGGMGLIANAADQGTRAMEYASSGIKSAPGRNDIAIVGAGPAGLAAALAAKAKGIDYVLLEQGDVGGAVLHFPRKKLVFTRPMDFPLYGQVNHSSMLKEQLVDLFRDVVEKVGLEVATNERVDGIEKLPDGGFTLTTSKRSLEAQRVVLTLGRRGTPRTLRVPGEDVDKVAYSLLEPGQFEYDHILVVGGGDSAVEAACTLAEQPGNKVTLSYRAAKINRPKQKNIERLRDSVRDGAVDLLLESEVKEIGEDRVVIEQLGEQLVLANDYIFVFVGGVLPTDFLRKAGVKVLKHFGKRIEDDAGKKDKKPPAPAAAAAPPPRAAPSPPRIAAPSAGELTVELPRSTSDGDVELEELEVFEGDIGNSGEPTQILPDPDAGPGLRAPMARSAPAHALPSRPRASAPFPSTGDPGTDAIRPGAEPRPEHTRRLPEPELEPTGSTTLPGRVVASRTAAQPQLRSLSFGELPASEIMPAEVDEVPLDTSTLLEPEGPRRRSRTKPSRLAATLDRTRERMLRGDVNGAEGQFHEALVAAEHAKRPQEIGRAHLGLAEARAIRGDLAGALARLLRAESMLSGTDAHAVHADVLAMAVDLELALGNHISALDRVETLLEQVTRHELTDHRALGASLFAEAMARVGFSQDAGEAALKAARLRRAPSPAHTEVRERAIRVLCDVGRTAEAAQAAESLPEPAERVVDDPVGQRLALMARVTAPSNRLGGRDMARKALGRPVPLFALRAARTRLDAAHALIAAGQADAARTAVKRGIKAIRGTGARGLKLELLLAFHAAMPDPRVAEAAARSALELMEAMPEHAREAFAARPVLSDALKQWDLSR